MVGKLISRRLLPAHWRVCLRAIPHRPSDRQCHYCTRHAIGVALLHTLLALGVWEAGILEVVGRMVKGGRRVFTRSLTRSVLIVCPLTLGKPCYVCTRGVGDKRTFVRII